MTIDFDDFEYAIPGERVVMAGEHRRIDYDLRMDDHQRRIAALEAKVRHVETLLHLAINHGRVDNYGNAIEGADGV